MTINGKISFQGIEGGFWGIIADDNSKYVPVDGIPSLYEEEGLEITAELEIVQLLGTIMWGQYVKIVSIAHAKAVEWPKDQ